MRPLKGQKNRHRNQHLAAGRRGEPEELTRGDCESRRKLAAACRKVSRRKQWHGAREKSSGLSGPKEIVDRGRNWPQPADGWFFMQKWHGEINTDFRDKSKMILHRELREDERPGRNTGR
jgi:hypothetical protein